MGCLVSMTVGTRDQHGTECVKQEGEIIRAQMKQCSEQRSGKNNEKGGWVENLPGKCQQIRHFLLHRQEPAKNCRPAAKNCRPSCRPSQSPQKARLEALE